MTQVELEKYQQRLLALGKRLTGDVSGLTGEALRQTGGEASGNLSNTPLHLADLGTDNFEQEVTLSLLETEGRRLEEIAAALERIRQKTYGTCQECRKEIPRERLDALPDTRYCVDCARKSQDQAPRADNLGQL
jgi:RNA polymerase-binding transcription factor DksA